MCLTWGEHFYAMSSPCLVLKAFPQSKSLDQKVGGILGYRTQIPRAIFCAGNVVIVNFLRKVVSRTKERLLFFLLLTQCVTFLFNLTMNSLVVLTMLNNHFVSSAISSLFIPSFINSFIYSTKQNRSHQVPLLLEQRRLRSFLY